MRWKAYEEAKDDIHLVRLSTWSILVLRLNIGRKPQVRKEEQLKPIQTLINYAINKTAG